MLLRRLFFLEKGKILLITSCLMGFVGVVSILFQLHIFFILLIAMIMVLQLFLYIKDKEVKKVEPKYVLDAFPMPVIITFNSKIQDVNNATVNLLGARNKKELIGRSFPELISLEEREDRSLHTADNQETNFSVKGKLNCINGRNLDVELLSSSSPSYQSDGGECYIIKDISEFMEREKKLQHSEQLSVLGELAAGIAHEIRNPLTSLKGFLQLSSSSEQNRGIYNDIMLSEINRINLIVGELLLLSKPKEMIYTSSHLLTLIRTVVTIVNTQAILYNIEINIESDPEVKDLKISCEENKLKQVFINLLKNGIEAMQKEGKMYIKVSKIKDRVHLTFIDEGQGISEEELEQLGKRFYSTKENGTGLGLMISFNIIENHKGKMNISSEVGKGTAIEISLPI
jgi:PAS domain S-box-containing protein